MNVNEALKSVKEELLNEPVVVEYFRLLSLIENDKELMNLNEDMRKHQKLMSENMDNDEIYFKEKDLYESLSNDDKTNTYAFDDEHNIIYNKTTIGILIYIDTNIFLIIKVKI